MDVAFVTALDGDTQTFVALDGAASSFGWRPGATIAARDGYCHYVISGELPNLIADARRHPFAATIPATEAAGMGSYVGVPLTLRSGRVYGALCVTSRQAHTELAVPDVAFMRFLAELVAEELSQQEARVLAGRLRREQLSAYLRPGAMTIHAQPIVDLVTGRVRGVEALARFPGHDSPAEVFAAAAQAGMGVAVELAAIRAALQLLPHIPQDVYLSINASPATAADPSLATILSTVPCERVVLELTEHVEFTEHAHLLKQLRQLQARGLRVAIDDTGSGYAGLQIILALAPDVLKLDMALVRGVDRDPARRALVRALAAFAAESGAALIAEGIQTPAELDTLRTLNVPFGQGYLLARPAPLTSLDLTRSLL